MDVSRKALQDTVCLYRKAVDFYIYVMLEQWEHFGKVLGQKSAVNLAENLTIVTRNRPQVQYNFGKDFYKFPSYLRRAAIAEAYGKVLSFKSNLANWEQADPRTRGAQPSMPKAG